jgi:hypothetical protein
MSGATNSISPLATQGADIQGRQHHDIQVVFNIAGLVAIGCKLLGDPAIMSFFEIFAGDNSHGGTSFLSVQVVAEPDGGFAGQRHFGIEPDGSSKDV